MGYKKYILWIGLLVFSLQASSNGDPRLKQAEDHETNYEYSEALILYDQVLTDRPNDMDVYLKRGVVHLHLDQVEEAQKDFNHVVNSDPMNVRGLLGMSKFYSYVQNVDSAIYFTNVAMMMSETFDEQKSSLVSRGEIQLDNGQFEEAESAFLKAYEMDQDDYSVLEKITFALHGQGKDEEAFRYLDMITDENEINGQSLAKMAYLMNKIAMYGEANLYLEQALNLDPDNPEAKCNMAYTYMQLGTYKQGLKYVEESIETNPLNSFAYRVKGEILGRMGKTSKCCQEFNRASSLGYVLDYGNDLYDLMDEYCQSEE